MLHVGSEAPDFSVPVHTGATVKLSSFRGTKNVVLFFYPRDFTPGCTRQACSFSAHYAEIASLNAEILGISADPAAQHRSFSTTYRLPYLLGSDDRSVIAKLYDAKRFGIRPLRITYVIDRNGIIRGRSHHEIFLDRHWKDVVTILRSIEHQS